uniref:Uncharacterized protein n=1 Tax=Photinus pyralis TaxID=7054 RepID=A0A1Y1NJV1_PHOPY
MDERREKGVTCAVGLRKRLPCNTLIDAVQLLNVMDQNMYSFLDNIIQELYIKLMRSKSFVVETSWPKGDSLRGGEKALFIVAFTLLVKSGEETDSFSKYRPLFNGVLLHNEHSFSTFGTGSIPACGKYCIKRLALEK